MFFVFLFFQRRNKNKGKKSEFSMKNISKKKTFIACHHNHHILSFAYYFSYSTVSVKFFIFFSKKKNIHRIALVCLFVYGCVQKTKQCQEISIVKYNSLCLLVIKFFSHQKFFLFIFSLLSIVFYVAIVFLLLLLSS